MKRSELVLTRLAEKGARITGPTKLVCGLIYDRPEDWHPRAEDIYKALVKQKRKVSQSTVYNILNKLHEHRLLREVTLNRGEHYFDTNLDVHYHLYCPKTRELQDIHCDDLKLVGIDKLSHQDDILKIDVIISLK